MSENFKTSCSLKRKSVYRGAGGGESVGRMIEGSTVVFPTTFCCSHDNTP